MFMIGDFAQLARVSSRVLRHYDRIDLLKPAHVDEATGYRFYGADQLADINRIVVLRDLGFGLTEIGEMTQEPMSSAELRAMLKLRQAQASAELEAAEQRLRRIDSRINQLEEDAPAVDLVSKSVPAISVWSMTYQTGGAEEAFNALSALVERVRGFIDDLVPPYAIARWATEFDEEDFAVEFSVPVDDRLMEAASGLGLEEVVLPAVEVVSTVRSTDPDLLHVTNGAIGQWIEGESLRIAGPIREVLLADPAAGDAEQVVEVQVPVAAV